MMSDQVVPAVVACSPPEWQPQSETIELFPLVQGSPECSQIEQRLKETIPSAVLIQVSRIQNTWLWERYSTHMKRLHPKNNGNVGELVLFHGTSGNDPKLIYEGEVGFDFRFSRVYTTYDNEKVF